MVASADERQRQIPRVGHVDRDVHQVLADPPGANGGAQGSGGTDEEEVAREESGDGELTERASQVMQGRAEGREEDVSGLVEGQVDQVQKAAAARIGEKTRRPEGKESQERNREPGRTAAGPGGGGGGDGHGRFGGCEAK